MVLQPEQRPHLTGVADRVGPDEHLPRFPVHHAVGVGAGDRLLVAPHPQVLVDAVEAEALTLLVCDVADGPELISPRDERADARFGPVVGALAAVGHDGVSGEYALDVWDLAAGDAHRDAHRDAHCDADRDAADRGAAEQGEREAAQSSSFHGAYPWILVGTRVLVERRSVPQCAAVCRSVPQCAAVCRSVLQGAEGVRYRAVCGTGATDGAGRDDIPATLMPTARTAPASAGGSRPGRGRPW